MRLKSVYDMLYENYGPQYWWPGETPFEIMVGAVLTQNTAWANVEKAITNLKVAGMLDARKIAAATHRKLAGLLKPAGYFNLKARRLKNFCVWYLEQGEFESLALRDTAKLRHDMLSVNGIGFETADDILLYAFNRPVFVIDAYTRRLFSRLKIVDGTEHYDSMRRYVERTLVKELRLGQDRTTNSKKRESELADLYNEFHALIVNHAKNVCRKRPVCDSCCHINQCPSASEFLNAH
jgi:endonuclease III related protein